MKSLITGFRVFFLLTILTGMVYPLLVTGIAQLCFNERANGSIIKVNGIPLGSELIGQNFTGPGYFHSRPSAVNYATVPGGASNLSPTSKQLLSLVEERQRQFIITNNLQENTPVPPDMLFASGSGLDPHISKESALFQVSRVAAQRSCDPSEIRNIVLSMIEKPQFNVFGQERVNVLMLNLELDKHHK